MEPVERVDGRRRFASATDSESLEIGVLMLAAAATATMLQATRVFLSYMVFIIDQSERVQLGVTAGAVYLGIALGAIIPRFLGLRHSVLAITTGMVTARLALQFWELPEARMWLGAATIVLSGWLLPLLLTLARSAAALGVGIGLELDIAFRIGRNSLDMAFIPGIGAHAITVGIVVLGVLGLVVMLRDKPSARPHGLSISALALGPALALHHLTFGNLGAVQLRLNASVTTSAWLISAGIVLGLTFYLLTTTQPMQRRAGAVQGRWMAVAVAIAGGLGLWTFWQDIAGLGAAGFVMGTAGTLALVLIALKGVDGEGGVTATALWLTFGLLIQAVVLFAYFTATGLPVLIVVLYAVLVLATLPIMWRATSHRPLSTASIGSLGAVSLALIVASVVLAVSAAAPAAGDPLTDEFTVMTYNIQSGFSRDNNWDLEAIARVIEDADPDVVILQEVGRGWPVLTGIDQAGWLSERLGMQLIWGPASQDDQWGNAILTTAPIISSDWVKYDTTENLRRGAVRAELRTDSGSVIVIGTHLDNPGGATSARQQQISQLLDFWGGDGPAIIAGDLNTDPGSDAILTIENAGFTDTGDGFGEDVYTSEDARRIDYVLITDGIDLVSADVPDVWASDHLPVVTTLNIAP